MKTFRGIETNGWCIIEATNKQHFINLVNKKMSEYGFIDFQFSTTATKQSAIDGDIMYTATILLGSKK